MGTSSSKSLGSQRGAPDWDLAAQQSNVTLIDEHFFDPLEKPELFRDQLHLNGPGMDRFSLMLTQEVSRILGPPR